MTIKHIVMPIPDPNPSENETYLGDGLYASFDGWQIQLRAPRPDGDHFIYMEPSVQVAFIEFIERIVGKR